MRDFARSDDPAVQAQLDRLGTLSVPQGRLGLETIRALLARLGDPHRSLPPVFHVAGTNGKGSVCAFLRAMLEADGKRVHATISPHLVRYNERIRLASELISDEALATLLEEVLDTGADLNPSFFEVTIAASFLAFSRTPADACVVEVGLGGRFDATNVLEPEVLAACGIAALGIDHERFLLAPEEGAPQEPLARIAFEKAGIAKHGIPLVSLSYPPEAAREIIAAAKRVDAPLSMRGDGWECLGNSKVTFRDGNGELSLPRPSLPGAHQIDNAALAHAMIRHQDKLAVSLTAMSEGIENAKWPARMQYLADGRLRQTVPNCRWLLDGGHNEQAAEALAQHFHANSEYRDTESRTPRYAIIGMLEAKNWRRYIDRIAPHICALVAVPVPGHDSASPVELISYARTCGVGLAGTAKTIEGAVDWLTRHQRPEEPLYGEVFIGGSLYLAGEVLRLNDEIPD